MTDLLSGKENFVMFAHIRTTFRINYKKKKKMIASSTKWKIIWCDYLWTALLNFKTFVLRTHLGNFLVNSVCFIWKLRMRMPRMCFVNANSCTSGIKWCENEQLTKLFLPIIWTQWTRCLLLFNFRAESFLLF